MNPTKSNKSTRSNSKLKYYMGRGLLHPEKLKIAEKYRGKALVDYPYPPAIHQGIAEIRFCAYMYWCYLHKEICWNIKDYEVPIRKQWMEDGILQPAPTRASAFIPKFTAKGKRFVKYVLKWAYLLDLNELLEGK